MPSTIQLKRGASTNLGLITPIVGEPIYLTDTNQILIGGADGTFKTVNNNNPNLLVNGNFQIMAPRIPPAINNTSSLNYIVFLGQGAAANAFGAYRFLNPGGGGNLFVTSPIDGIISMTNDRTNVTIVPQLEYNFPYSKMYTDVAFSTGTQNIPYSGKTMTLSFYLASTFAGSAKIGQNQAIINFDNSNVLKRYSTTFVWSETTSSQNIYFSLPIIKITTPYKTPDVIRIGNIKLEYGAFPTDFYPNNYLHDLGAIRSIVQSYNGSVRAVGYDANNLYFSLIQDNYLSRWPTYRTRVIELNTPTIRTMQNFSGASETGFTFATADNSNTTGEIVVTATKTAHGLTDAVLRYNLVIDYGKPFQTGL